ncbi:MAG: hypothetical protein EOP92_23045 [Lysobacteraceae bacterium]|nr:MAG: hypothetical protein EOP92_23045 [Xanthomonadaceae bacterium]
MRPLFSVFLASMAAAALPLPALAASDDARFTLRLGAMDVDAQGEITANTVFQGEDLQFAQDFDFGGKEIVPRLDGTFRFGERSRLVFDYFRYDKDREAVLGEDLSFDEVTIPAGSFARAETRFQLASLMYDYSIVEAESVSVGLQIGAEWAKLEGRLQAEAGEATYDDRATEDGFAPVVGARVTFTPGEKWRVNLQGQYLDADWGDFGDYEGSISRANALVEYRFTENFGVFAGYDWFKLDATRHGGDGSLGLDQRFKGPVAGVTLAF